MAKKIKLSHEVDGEVFTRTTHAKYTHVVVTYGGERQIWVRQNERGTSTAPFVNSWHGSEAAAEKKARSMMAYFARYSSSTNAVVEAINGGQENKPAPEAGYTSTDALRDLASAVRAIESTNKG